MSDMMTFPATVEEFMEQYKIVDDEKVYTNGAELVPIFRMMQWFEHVSATDKNVGTTDTISRQQAIEAVTDELDMIDHVPQWVFDRLEKRLKQLPPAQPEQRTEALKAEIKRMKMSFTTCINRDYYTGYMSALSAVEGFIAQLEGKE